MTNPQSFSWIGIPDHQGVSQVGGRLGAALGPKAFLAAFDRLNGRKPVHAAIQELRMVTVGAKISENHQAAADAVSELHSRTGRSVVVGGGHDHGYSHLLGLSRALPRVTLGCINLDAHLDVRKPNPEISSGSPFYLTLENKIVAPKNLIEFGIQDHCNGPEGWAYVEKLAVPVIGMRELRSGQAVPSFTKNLRELCGRCDHVVISLDLDCLRAADAPGVSAPQAEGFSSSEIIEMMEIAATEKKVVSIGIFELNPIHDLDARTARLAATAAYHWIAGQL